MTFNKNCLFLIGFFVWFQTIQAQTIEPGSAADAYLRYLQLDGRVGDSISLVNRPANLFTNHSGIDSNLSGLVRTGLFWKKKRNIFWGVLPASLDQQYFSHHPFAQNDGVFIQAKGYQAKLAAGFFARIGPLSVQVQPEVLWAANPQYPFTRSYGTKTTGAYRKVFPGQSSVSLNLGPAAVSVSTGNMWWGSGVYHSLMMTNQAPGFLHAKFHSIRPLRTPIGNFEWTLLGGKLTSDPVLPFDNNDLRGNLFYKPTADRYLSAYVFSYQPVFLKGFNVGISRALQLYQESLQASGESWHQKYFPIVFKPLQKENAPGEDTKVIDQLASAFFRWVWPKSKAELYGEYGFNDYKANTRDFVLNMPHSAAYQLGFRKIVATSRKADWIGGLEVTQLAQSADQLVRDAGNWYYHGGVVEGYTHQNQVLGAAFASNTQTVEVARQMQTQRTAFSFQRFQRDPHRDAPRWSDWVLGISHSQPYKGFYLNADIKGVFSRNYAWQSNNNPFQILAKAGVRYYFHD